MTETPGLPPPRPIPLKDRAALVFVERAQHHAQARGLVQRDLGLPQQTVIPQIEQVLAAGELPRPPPPPEAAGPAFADPEDGP